MPLEPTQRTLNLGTKYGPEFACLPLKITLGTYMEGIQRGADTIVTSGGVGPCRAGYYSALHKKILSGVGCDVRMVVFEPPMSHKRDTLAKVKMLNSAHLSGLSIIELLYPVYAELLALDHLERALRRAMPRETVKGASEAGYKKGVEMVFAAAGTRQIREAEAEGLRLLRSTPQDETADPVRIGMVGEIYVLLEPASNLYMERVLGELGAEVHKSMYLTNWIMGNVVVEGGGFSARKAAAKYLPEMVGGHGQDSVGNTVIYAEQGLDGVIQLAPFTCIPEIVAKAVLARVSEEHSIPVLSFFLDEQTGEAGMRTRLEAFVDMLKTRKAGAARAVSASRNNKREPLRVIS
ncbi:MAG: CoA protein activase [Bacillota bacterium]